MGFVEAVARKLFHQVEDALGLFIGDFVGLASGHELGALRGHLFFFLFAHGAAQDVRFAQRKTRQAVGDLHHLLLIQNHAPGFRQDVFQLRQVVSDFFLPVFPRDEVVNHPALDRAGAIERVQRGQIFEARRLIAAQNITHAVRFKLEYAGGVPACEKLISFHVVGRKTC